LPGRNPASPVANYSVAVAPSLGARLGSPISSLSLEAVILGLVLVVVGSVKAVQPARNGCNQPGMGTSRHGGYGFVDNSL